MIYIFDLDGTICEESTLRDGTSYDFQESYKNLAPIPSTIDKIRSLYVTGHRIIIWTARYPEDFLISKEWLEKYKVPFHELHLGKIKGDHYVDTNCLRPDEI